MIFKLAFRNVIGYGWRSVINVFIIALVLVGLVWMISLWASWINLAKTQQQDWEYGSGTMRARAYDPLDMFSWEKAYAPVPSEARPHIDSGLVVPVLFSPGALYSHGRMTNVMIKGIPAAQKVLKIPSATLENHPDHSIPALLGKAMAKSARLQEGDIFTIRIKDAAGAFNTLDLTVAQVMDCPVPSLDVNTVWMDLEALRQAKDLPDQATVLVLADSRLSSIPDKDFRYIERSEFFADIDQMVKTKAGGQSFFFMMLIGLAMLAVFDTQALAVFKRRKEIGTLSALGFTKGQIIRIFTLEGSIYVLLAMLAGAVLGLPLFWYFGTHGLTLPGGSEGFGVQGFDEPLKFVYPPHLILLTLVFVFGLTVFVSWLPARRISRLNPTDAIRGRDHA